MKLYEAGTIPIMGNLRVWKNRVTLRLNPCRDESDLVWIDTIVAREPRKGHGSDAMDWLTELADRTGCTLRLDAVPLGAGDQKMSVPRLVRFYRKFGFQQPWKDQGMERKALAAAWTKYPSLYKLLKQGVGDIVDPRYPSWSFDIPDFGALWSSDYANQAGQPNAQRERKSADPVPLTVPTVMPSDL